MIILSNTNYYRLTCQAFISKIYVLKSVSPREMAERLELTNLRPFKVGGCAGRLHDCIKESTCQNLLAFAHRRLGVAARSG